VRERKTFHSYQSIDWPSQAQKVPLSSGVR